MIRVQRHRIKPYAVGCGLDYSLKSLEARRSAAFRSASNLSMRMRSAMDVGIVACMEAPKSVHLKAFHEAAQAGAALFAFANGYRGELPVGDQRLKFVEPPDESHIHTGKWETAFYLNLLCRDSNGLNLLCEVPVDLLRKSSTTGPEYSFKLVDALKAVWKTDPRAVSILTEAMLAATSVDSDFTIYLDSHRMALIGLAGDSDFEELLANGLKDHKEYWTASKDRRIDPHGFVSIPLCAIAAFAYDNHVPFQLDSEYLPMRLVDGSFLKTEQTGDSI